MAPAFAADDLGPAVLAATVRDRDGHPVSGALVVADGPTSREATTGVAGVVTLVALPIGTYDVRVTRAGFAPLGTRISLNRLPIPRVLALNLTRATFSGGLDPSSTLDVLDLSESADVLVAHMLSRAEESVLLPVRGTQTGSAPVLAGTTPGETRVELDGIPLAGGAAAFTTLRDRDALGLDSVALVEGPVTSGTSPRGAIGGVVDYRTADFSDAPKGTIGAGYDAQFGYFQHFAAVETLGRLGVVADVVTGDGEAHAQTLKTRYAFSSATSLELDSYGMQSTSTVAGSDARSTAPVIATDLRTSLGAGTIEARFYRSAFSSTSDDPGAASPASENASARGVQATYSLPAGENIYSFDYDRRNDDVAAGAATLAQTVSTIGIRADLQLSKLSRLEIGERYSSGDGVGNRSDPFAGISLRPNDRVTIRASAGSAFETPLDAMLLNALPGAPRLSPETSFGYRISVDDTPDNANHLFASAYDVRRFDRFATYAGAHTSGIDAGITHDAASGGFGGSAYVALERSDASGSLQPAARIASALAPDALLALAGQPYAKAGTTISWRAPGGVSYALGTTMFGANNALSAHAIAFTDATLTMRFQHVGDVRAGIDNIFGSRVTEPLLAPYYLPREFVLILSASPAQSAAP